MRFSRHAKNRMRLYELSIREIEGVVIPMNLWGIDQNSNPVFVGQDDDRRVTIVIIAFDQPNTVITVYVEE